MIQKDDLVWLSPEKFGTRRAELSAKKQGRELTIDGSGIAVKEKPTTVICSLASDLELVMALRRRALAFDLIGVASFNTINKYHQALAQRLQELTASGVLQGILAAAHQSRSCRVPQGLRIDYDT